MKPLNPSFRKTKTSAPGNYCCLAAFQSRSVLQTRTKCPPACVPHRGHVELLQSGFITQSGLKVGAFSPGCRTGTKGPLEPRLMPCFLLVTHVDAICFFGFLQCFCCCFCSFYLFLLACFLFLLMCLFYISPVARTLWFSAQTWMNSKFWKSWRKNKNL